MIGSFKTRALKRLYEKDDGRGIPADHVARVKRILALLDVATKPKDMDIPGWRVHPLKGNYKGFWSVDVSGNYRVIFRFEDGDPCDVAYLDTH